MRSKVLSGIAVSIGLAALAGCGSGGGSSPAPLSSVTTREATTTVVQKAASAGSLIGVITRALGPSLQIMGSRAKHLAPRSRQTSTQPTVITEQLADGSMKTTISFADGSTSVFVEGVPQQAGPLTTSPYTAVLTYPANTGSLSMQGTRKEDNRGTPTDFLDDLTEFTGTMTGSLTESGSAPTSLTGTFGEKLDMQAGTISADSSFTATVASIGMTLRQQASYSLTNFTGSATTTITTPDGGQTTLTETQNQDGTTAFALADRATGLQMAVNYTATGTGSGALSVSGVPAGTIEVTADGIATVHYLDGTSDTFDLSGMEMPAL